MSEKMKEEKKVEAANETNLKKEVNNKEEQKKGLFNKKEDPQKIKLEKEIKKLKDENKVLNDKVLRISAEMQNMMRRNEEKVQNLLKYEGEDLIKNTDRYYIDVSAYYMYGGVSEITIYKQKGMITE